MKLCLTGPQILWLFDWHGGQGDPIYAVASRGYARAGNDPDHPPGVCLEISEREYEAIRSLAENIREERAGYRGVRQDKRCASAVLRRLGPRPL